MTVIHAILIFMLAAVLAGITAGVGRKFFAEWAGLAAFIVFVVVLLVGFSGELGTL